MGVLIDQLAGELPAMTSAASSASAPSPLPTLVIWLRT